MQDMPKEQNKTLLFDENRVEYRYYINGQVIL